MIKQIGRNASKMASLVLDGALSAGVRGTAARPPWPRPSSLASGRIRSWQAREHRSAGVELVALVHRKAHVIFTHERRHGLACLSLEAQAVGDSLFDACLS
jgi:hypothetical protein